MPNLLINIWTYAGHLNDPHIKQYEKCCVEAAKAKWQPPILNFDYVIQNLKRKNNDFSKISLADRRIIYILILKW